MKSGFMSYGQSLVVALSLLATLQTYGASARALIVGEVFVDPVGFYDATPTFSWKLPDGMKKQTAYCIETTSAEKTLWNSGWVNSDQSVGVKYGGPALASRQKVEWRLRGRDQWLTGAGSSREFWSKPVFCRYCSKVTPATG
jgi:alpha-L-rhamnosidase